MRHFLSRRVLSWTATPKVPIEIATLLIASQVLVGCAALLAGAGDGWSRGQPRITVEERLGRPIAVTPEANGNQVAVYEYERRRPSAKWAQFHADMSMQTFGFWEIFGMPIEAVRDVVQREAVRLTVAYDREDRVVDISESILPAATSGGEPRKLRSPQRRTNPQTWNPAGSPSAACCWADRVKP